MTRQGDLPRAGAAQLKFAVQAASIRRALEGCGVKWRSRLTMLTSGELEALIQLWKSLVMT